MRCGYLLEGVVALLVWLLLGWSGECAINVCVEGVTCAEVLTGGGLGLRHSLLSRGLTSGIPLKAGIGPPAFPCGDWASLHSAFPTPLPRGPWHNNRKKLKRAPARPS